MSNVRSQLTVSLWRGGAQGRYETYAVPLRENQTVLDVVTWIQRNLDPTLAYRFACRVGMCGSCAMVVDGRERWACRTRLAAVARAHSTITLRPLYHFPLIRDLVVDMAPFVAKMKAVGAAFQPREPAPAEPAAIPGDGAERRAIDAAIECIGCGACVSACTMARWAPEFPGPAALNRALTLVADRRDAGGMTGRWDALFGEDGVWRCHGQAQCTAVCPMELSPADSILRLRRRAARSLFLRT
jgi:fumarate reductase iron-sulfur subunit